MRSISPVVALLLLLCALGCGKAENTETSNPPSRQAEPAAFATVSEPGGKPNLKIVPSELPPPDHMLVRDLRKGVGLSAHHGDRVAVYYKGVAYRSGELKVHAWRPARPLIVRRLGFEGWGDSWEEGIEGMKEKGRRELVIPKALTGQGVGLDYVVELVRVWPQNGK